MSVGFGYHFGQLQSRAPMRRNAPPPTRKPDPPPYQGKLRDYNAVLVKAYGHRKDFKGPNGELIPFIPMPFAEEMLRFFRRMARHFLGTDLPDGSKQPNFIRTRVDAATAALGKVINGKMEWDRDAIEPAPAHVAGKAPDYFNTTVAAGLAFPFIVKADRTWAFLDALQGLAFHFDAISGSPTKTDIWIESVSEAIDELPQTIANAGKTVYRTVMKPIQEGKKWLLIILGVGAAVVAVYFLRGRK